MVLLSRWYALLFSAGLTVAALFPDFYLRERTPNSGLEKYVRDLARSSPPLTRILIAVGIVVAFLLLSLVLFEMNEESRESKAAKRAERETQRMEAERKATAEREATQLASAAARAEEQRRAYERARSRRPLTQSEMVARDEQARALALERAEQARTLALNLVESGGPARVANDADDFEVVSAEFMRSAGFADARRTPKGPDGGNDVVSSGAVGQAKFYSNKKVIASEIRALHGSRDQRGRSVVAMFFAWGLGYTDDAINTARQLNVYCYKYNVRLQRFDRVR